jgi:radical SAM superfamily enzyme YgiQ (UPF0313 family)
MSNVVLVEPMGGFITYQYLRLPLLGLLYLGTILKEHGHDVTILAESHSPVFDEKTNKLHPRILDADVVGFSTMTYAAERVYKIADAIKRARPSITTLIGGPHPTFMPDEALHHVDYVVKGEGDLVIPDIINGSLTPGVIQGQLLGNLDNLPYPDLDLLPHNGTRLSYIPISMSRGCPYDCNFCSVTAMFGRRYRFRSPENVVEEIEMRLKQGHHEFMFYDDNFGAHRNHTKTLLELVLRRNLKFHWFAEARVEIARDPELLDLIARTGGFEVLIGFESVNPRTLEAFNKHQTLKDIHFCIQQLKKHRIKTWGLFILGSDEDDLATVDRTLEFCNQMKMEMAQFAILSPFPGTRIFQQFLADNRILSRAWSLYDGLHVVFQPARMSALELQKKVLWAWKKIFSLSRLRYFLGVRYILYRWHRYNKQFMTWLRHIGKTVPPLSHTSSSARSTPS